MANVRALLANLAMHGARLDGGGPSTAGHAGRLTSADLAAAVGFVHSRLGQDLVLLLWAGHDARTERATVLESIEDWLAWADRARRRRKGDGPALSPGERHDLAVVTLQELAATAVGTACSACRGSGEVMMPTLEAHPDGEPGFVTGASWAECPQCLGTGTRRLSAREKARMIGCSRHRWEHRYAGPQLRAYRWLLEVEKEAITEIKQALEADS